MNPELRLVVDWEPRWRGFITSVRPALARTPHYTYSRLTVNWERRWPAFVSSVRPALTRTDKPLDAECPAGLFSRHGIGLSLAGHVGVIVILALLSARVLRGPDLGLQQAAKHYDVIYYSGDLLPQTEDAGGAEAGREG